MNEELRERARQKLADSFLRMIKRLDELPPEKEVNSIEELLAWLNDEPAVTKG